MLLQRNLIWNKMIIMLPVNFYRVYNAQKGLMDKQASILRISPVILRPMH